MFRGSAHEWRPPPIFNSMHVCIGVFESFFLDPSSFICCVCKYIYWNICCVCKYIYNQYICGVKDQFRSDGSSTPGVIPDQSIFGLWDLDCLVNRMEHMQVANGCWRTRWGSYAVLACMSVSNQLIILDQLSNVANLGSSSHFEIAALFGRQRCGSIYFDLCFCLGCIDITNNWFECSANHFRTTQIHPHIKADHQTYPSLLHSHSTTHRCEKCELKATTPNTNKKHDRSLPVGSMEWPNLSI